MNLCSSGHEEVCFEGRICPVCEVIEDKDREIDKLTDKIHGLESENADLEDQITELKKEAES